MPKMVLTDEEVEAEIAKLKADPDVKLARAEQHAKYRQRQVLYNLRALAKRGAELRENGFTVRDFRVDQSNDNFAVLAEENEEW